MAKNYLKIKEILRRNIKSTTENINNGYFSTQDLVLKAANSRRADAIGLLIVDTLGLFGLGFAFNFLVGGLKKLADIRR